MSDAAIRVLLVDDSAVVRNALRHIIEATPDICVAATAPNGRLALDALRQVPIDVVLLDIEMPEMDGLTALPLMLAAHPEVRVIMASSLTQAGAGVTMRALALGAVDHFAKPSARAGARVLGEMSAEIVAKIRAIGRAAHRARAGLPRVRPPTPIYSPSVLGGLTADAAPQVIAIASSTGGPNALIELLGRLSGDFPLPILITQHMPPLFTTLLAQRITRDAHRDCVEAVDGQPVVGGRVYLAPGDFHMLVHTHEGVPRIQLSTAPPEHYCRPAADVMLRSVAAVYGPAAVAIVLTGMGEDGRRGCEVIRHRGGQVIAQDEASSVVWGMPGAVVAAGLANHVLPLIDIPVKLSSLCRTHA